MTANQKKIERIHQRLMDLRDSTPARRGYISAENRYLKVYMEAYRKSRISAFYGAAEKYRHFLEDRPKAAKICVPAAEGATTYGFCGESKCECPYQL